MSEYADAKNYFQRLVNFSSASVYKDMLHHAIAAFDRAEAAEAEVTRLTAASWMAEAGIPMSEIAAVLGHRDSRTTERIYAKFSPDYLQRAVRALG